MELAHVVYRVSTDADYAAQLQSDPVSTIGKLGLKLSAEELASLLAILRRNSDQESVGLTAHAAKGLNWG